MKSFSDLQIEVRNEHFVGDKIKVKRILNKEIIVLNSRIEKSKFEDSNSGKRLKLQIEFEGEKRIIFTSSRMLTAAMEQVPKNALPFKTTIIEEGEAYQFN